MAVTPGESKRVSHFRRERECSMELGGIDAEGLATFRSWACDDVLFLL